MDIEKVIQETESFLAERKNDIPLNVFRYIQKVCEDERKYIDMIRNYKVQKPVLKY